MSYGYDLYLKEHRENVRKGADWLCINLPDVCSAHYAVFDSHDSSKDMYDEYDAYDAYFYGKNKSYQVVQDFKLAWLTHIHRNPHHWQHWVLINDDPKEGEVVLDMPYPYILEMICDWWAFSWKSGNLHEIFKWYDEHKDYMKLSPKTRKTVEDILEKIKKKLEEVSDGLHD